MSLIPVSKNILVNPCNVDSLEQRDMSGTTAYFVIIGQKEYLLTVPLEQFIKDMDYDKENDEQHWAG